MDNAYESEQSRATRFGLWIDDKLAGAGSSIEYGKSSWEGGLAQGLISWRDEPPEGLLKRVAAIPHANRQTPDRGKRGWHRRWVLATAAIIAITVVAAVPYTRNAVAGVFGFDVVNTPAIPISVPVPGSTGLSAISSAAPGLGDDFRLLLVELPVSVPKLGPSEFESLGFLPIEPGTKLEIGNDETFEVPGGLPGGFEWRGMVRTVAGRRDCIIGESCDGFTPSIGRIAWGGGEDALMSSITPIYLVATDNSGNLLVLSRFVVEPGTRVSAKAFNAGGGRQFGVIFEPTKSDTTITFLVADGVELTQTEGVDALAYTGTWDLSGDWNDDDGWRNLTWEGRDGIYHLSAQIVPTETLLKIAAEVRAASLHVPGENR